jgi:hypothetical protein
MLCLLWSLATHYIQHESQIPVNRFNLSIDLVNLHLVFFPSKTHYSFPIRQFIQMDPPGLLVAPSYMNGLALATVNWNSLASPKTKKFLYRSHYSSPGVVLHYIIRQVPFTSMAIDLQLGRFDCPMESWKSCNTLSSDMKELIPEFFTVPEILLDTNEFPLG